MDVEEQFQEAYRRYASFVFSHLVPILRNEADAWDITQETFIRYYRFLRKDKQVNYPLTFLYRTATRLAVKFLGRAHRRIEPMADPPEVVVPDDSWRVEAWSIVRVIWDRLDPKAKVIAKLLVIDQMTPQEICEYSGMGRGQVYRRIRKIRAIASKSDFLTSMGKKSDPNWDQRASIKSEGPDRR